MVNPYKYSCKTSKRLFVMRALPTDFPQVDFMTLHYRADINLLVCRWQRPISGAEFQQGYRTLLRAAQTTNCPFWLLDVRGHTVPEAGPMQWLKQEFLPHLAGQVGRSICLGYLLSPSQLRQVVPPADDGVCVAFFSEEGPLTAWLTQCQHRSRAALVQTGFMPPPPAA